MITEKKVGLSQAGPEAQEYWQTLEAEKEGRGRFFSRASGRISALLTW